MPGLPCGNVRMDWDFDPPRVEDEMVLGKIERGLKIPTGRRRSSTLIRTSYIVEYFEGKGKHPPKDGGHEENARLWLWWFLGATYFGDKGERVGTSVLNFLLDLEKMGDYDWVTPALGLTIKYCRDVVRPDEMDRGSCPSLVFPGIIMESWVLSHFPSLLPLGFVAPATYPTFHGWGTCDRCQLGWTYDGVRRQLNMMSIDKAMYSGVPDALIEKLSVREMMRLYLDTPHDSFWYLGERLAYQTVRGQLSVLMDPPACLFLQTRDPEVRRRHGEGRGETLLLEGQDYYNFARRRLACGPIDAYDEDMEYQPSDFPTAVEFENLGVRRTLELPKVTTVVADYGMESWVDKVKKVDVGIHKKLWRMANRWRELAARQVTELRQSQREIETMKVELAEYRRSREARQD